MQVVDAIIPTCFMICRRVLPILLMIIGNKIIKCHWYPDILEDIGDLKCGDETNETEVKQRRIAMGGLW